MRWDHLFLLASLASLLLFLGLGNLGLTDRDEGSNAEAAREMVETGDWITPTLNYEPRFAKPVFIYWLMSSAYLMFGISEFTARLPSAVFGVALILLQYLFLARERGPMLGLFSSLMLLLNVEMVAIGRLALTDSVLVFFTTLSLYGFWIGLHGEGRLRHAIWGFYLGMALGTLTKGPVGVAVPLLATVPYLTITRRWGEFWRRGFPIAGMFLFLIVALPWYAAMLVLHGSRYTASAQADTIGRFLNVIGGHGGTIFFYFPVLLFGFFPWSGLLPASLYHVLRLLRGVWGEGPKARCAGTSALCTSGLSSLAREREIELFAALWLVAVFLFFTLSATRLPHYIAPLYPAAAILTASFWERALADPATPGVRGSIHFLMALGYLMGIALAASPALYETFIDKIAREFPAATQIQPGYSLVAAGFVVVVGMALVGYFGLSEVRRPGAFWAAAVTLFIVVLIIIQATLPHFSRYFIAPPQELAYIAGVNLGQSDRLILYGPPKPSQIFYARHKATVIRPGQEEEMRRSLAEPGLTMILLPSRLRSSLPPEASGYVVLLERYGYTLLGNQPMVPPMAPPSTEPPRRSSPY